MQGLRHEVFDDNGEELSQQRWTEGEAPSATDPLRGAPFLVCERSRNWTNTTVLWRAQWPIYYRRYGKQEASYEYQITMKYVDFLYGDVTAMGIRKKGIVLSTAKRWEGYLESIEMSRAVLTTARNNCRGCSNIL